MFAVIANSKIVMYFFAMIYIIKNGRKIICYSVRTFDNHCFCRESVTYLELQFIMESLGPKGSMKPKLETEHIALFKSLELI